MTSKIFRAICSVAVVIFLASFVFIMGVLYNYFSNRQMKSLKTELILCSSAVERDGLDYLESLTDGEYRITWISEDGTVIFDSKVKNERMENHLEREEISEALLTGDGESVRRSDTLMEKQLYTAHKLSDGTVLRLSESYLTLWSLIFSMAQPISIVIFIAICLSLGLAYRLSKQVVKPLNDMDLDNLSTADGVGVYEEITPLLNKIKMQQQQLKLQKKELAKKQEEFDTATRYMNEGIILLSENGVILSINQSASKLFGISQYCIGKDLLLFISDFEIQELLRITTGGTRCEKVISIDERAYQLNASPIINDGKVSGIALIIFDITEKEIAEETRREFTANVSHELKTPLQNISGSAELLANGLVRDEDVPQFAENIYSETKRMITLVEDIIKLSHMDEGSEEMNYQEIDLYELAELTVRNLMPVAQSANIALNLYGNQTVMNGVPQMLSGIIYNLCDNAIKYNRPGGNVDVKIESTESCAILTVSDTGIGIPADVQGRVFERFYRVDKSRSKAVGGTGLGLSIVKHSVKLHGGEIEMRSIVDKGTTVIITLPKSTKENEVV